jgi:hypothetical protein
MALHRIMCQLCVLMAFNCSPYIRLASSAVIDDVTLHKQTSWISASSMHPLTSVLLANTSRLAPESLCVFERDQDKASVDSRVVHNKPLPAIGHVIHPYNLQSLTDQLRQLPRSRHQSFRSNFSNMNVMSSGHRHPLKTG